MPWRAALLRGARVLARCEPSGEPRVEGGRVEIRYRRDDGKAYRAAPGNLTLLDEPLEDDDHCAAADAVGRGGGKAKGASKGTAAAASAARALPKDAVVAYTDGACSGNPGPAGMGVVVLVDGRRLELSEYLGEATNNVAELAAIGAAADAVEPTARPLCIHTDSKYCIGLMTKGWKPKKNQQLVASVKESLARHPDWRLIYVPGHSGVPLNERADELAVQAVRDRGSAGWIEC